MSDWFDASFGVVFASGVLGSQPNGGNFRDYDRFVIVHEEEE